MIRALRICTTLVSVSSSLSAMKVHFEHEKICHPGINFPLHKIYAYASPAGQDTQKQAKVEIGYVSFVQDYIIHLGVEKPYRKKGLGTQLCIRALSMIKRAGYQKAEWRATNSIPFYLRMGAKLKQLPDPVLILGTVEYNATMEFDFERDGDPRINAQKFKQHFIAYK